MAKGTELAKAYVQIIPSADGIKDKLSSVLNKESAGAADSTGESLGKSLVGKISSVVAAAGLGKIVSDALNEGADLQQSVGGIETLFKDSADTVKQYANEAYKTAGMSANEYMQSVTGFSASLLQGLGGDTAAAAEIANMALVDMSDNANKMGSDMESIKNAYQGFAKQNYTMLDNLKLGYGGTKSEMERLLADAQELSGVEYDISNLADVYNAIHVIQEDMDITGTTANEASSTFSGSLASMKSAAKNLMANLTLGEDVGPALGALEQTVFTFITGNLIPMVGNLLQSLPEVLDSTLSMAVRGLNIASNNSDQLVQNGMDIVAELATGIISVVPYLAESGWKLITSLGKSLLSADWSGMANGMISKLQNNLDLAAGEILGTDGNIVGAVLDSITANLPSVLSQGTQIILNIVNGILMGLPSLITTAGSMISQFCSFVLLNLPSVLRAGSQLLLELVNGIISNLPSIAESVMRVIAQFIATVGSNLPQILDSGLQIIGELAAGLIQAIPKVVAAIPQVIQGIKNAFGEFDWKEIGGNIIDGIKNGISNGLQKITDAAKSVAKGALDAAKAALGIASPSKEFYKLGDFSIAGWVNAVMDNIGLVRQTMAQMATSALSASDTAFSSRLTTGSRLTATAGNGSAGLNARIDMILAILSRYLPECAKPVNVDGDSIFNSLNRQLGLAVTG